ncbi:MAG: hypothetical protein J6Z13_03220 [Clostridia bacterium]|nr:hypothetical protein [Clostridia bacterium]
MKKALVFLLALALLLVSLVSCAKHTPADDATVKVGYLSGSTGLGLSKMIADNKDNEQITFTKYNSPAEIMAAYANGDIDLAALPTNAFPNYSKSVTGPRSIKMLALNTLGVLYLLSDDGTTVSPSDLSSLSGKTVYVPEQAPKLVLQYLLTANHVENVTLDMQYDLETLPAAAQTDPDVHYILFPEPKVTVLLNTAGSKTYSISLDLTEAWNNVGDEPLVQGCMIVSGQFAADHAGLIDSFLTEYEASINWMKDPANLDAAAQYAVDAGIFPKLPIAKQAIPRCNLAFISGASMKTTSNAFLSALGIALPADDAYYGAN